MNDDRPCTPCVAVDKPDVAGSLIWSRMACRPDPRGLGSGDPRLRPGMLLRAVWRAPSGSRRDLRLSPAAGAASSEVAPGGA